MTPGPKKKNFNRHGGDKVADNRQDSKKKTAPVVESLIGNKSTSISSNVGKASSDLIQDSKYSKRTINSNWNKYDEPVIDPHADTMRGRDFEVLLSYSGGLESQLRLQDEKEWDDTCIGEKSITFDLEDLANAVKCIPFHKRINLPADIFENAQLERFNSIAGRQKELFESKLDQPLSVSTEKTFKGPEPVDPNSNIIESYESEEIRDVPVKSIVLEEKTENIIESLASCLSLKSLIQKPEKQPEQVPNNEACADDLDFLLSLSTTTSSIAVKEEEPKEQKQTNVDDWLNSLLDD